MDSLPYEHCNLTAMVRTSNRDGVVSDGFGSVRVRALEGSQLALEIIEDLSGLTITAVLDFGRPRRARVGLQSEALREALTAACHDDGLPEPYPEPR